MVVITGIETGSRNGGEKPVCAGAYAGGGVKITHLKWRGVGGLVRGGGVGGGLGIWGGSGIHANSF